ncbi:MAG: patatin-like phospholipase family protein [Eubacterium sp.]|nr:patatin-like phospholipase family protein [Eubacterium sp.]
MEGAGLVLAGGGGKGIYQVGMIKSLAAAGLLDDIVAVSGTSIGSVNAVLFAEGLVEGRLEYEKSLAGQQAENNEDLKRAAAIKHAVQQMESTWDDIDFHVFFDFETANVQVGDSHFSRYETEKLIDKYLSYELFENESALPTYVTSAQCPPNVITYEHISAEEYRLLTSGSVDETYRNYIVEYMQLNNKSNEYIKKAILATTALPVIYSPVTVDGKLYVDGGVKDNVPIKPLYDMGIRRFIVIELDTVSGIKYPAQYSDAEIIDILPSHELGKLISGTMNFDSEDKAIKKELGIRDGKRYIKTLFEKDESYIAIEKELALRDYNDIITQREFKKNYDRLESDIESRFDYIRDIENKYKF